MKKKILFLCQNIKDVKNSTRYQRACVLNKIYDVTLLCSTPPAKNIKDMFSTVIVLPRVLYYILSPILILSFKLMGVNIIHTQYNVSGILNGWLAKTVFNYWWVYDLWDHPSLQVDCCTSNKSRVLRWLWDSIAYKMLRVADVWVIGMHSGICSYLPAPSAYTKIIKTTNGVSRSSESFGFIPSSNDLFRNNKITLGYVGAITAGRGFDLMLDVLVELEKNGIFCELRAYGACTDVVNHAADIHNKKCANEVILYGYLDHEYVESAMVECDICFCLLIQSIINYQYAYPIKLFEYLSMGKIVIATRTPATSEVVTDNVNGFLVENTVADITRAIKYVITLPEKKQSDISNSAIFLSKKYLWEDINKALARNIISAFSK